MISGLEAYIRDSQLASKVDLTGSVVGVSGELLAEISVDALAAAAEARNFTVVVVFDGPSRPTPARVNSTATFGHLAELKNRGIKFLVAPGVAAAQLSYMYREGFVTHIAAADDCVLFGDAPIVVGLLSEPKVVSFTSLVQSTPLSPQDFAEVCIGAGCALIPERCPLYDLSMNPIKAGLKVAQVSGGSVFRTVTQLDVDYAGRFQTALAAINWQPVLNGNGMTELLNLRKLPEPQDLRTLIGLRLPDEYNYYLSKGLVSTELLRGLVWGWVADDASNARGVPQADYNALQKILSPLRGAALDWLSSAINRYFQFSKVSDRTPGCSVLDRKRIAPLRSEQLSTPELVQQEVVSQAQKVSGATSVEELLKKAGVSPTPQLETSAKLALRWLAEAIHVALMATGASKEPISGWP
ncbi:hypothetical protein B9G98_02454 [Wickerhamiella sorbophila]|uniref:Post-transcriptional regulator MKT1 N-terminal domain-containing protein n=1 Tax=Wickerhamiella sorbophila TaxID=45607 RepID=A0A2T0FIK5_9ASCO|nr:hypothetical protein B9G98_02454 [Wickerhamiella sorbophila]PRT54834.1 hypothetical protein B9G98_02454 [Wickerhamiella sorbophila]